MSSSNIGSYKKGDRYEKQMDYISIDDGIMSIFTDIDAISTSINIRGGVARVSGSTSAIQSQYY